MYTHSDDCGERDWEYHDLMSMPGPVEAMQEWQRRPEVQEDLESTIEKFGNFGEEARWSGRSDWLHTCPDRGIIGLGPVTEVCPFCGTPQPRKD